MAIVDGHIRCSGCKELRPVAAFPPSYAARGSGECGTCISKRSAARRRKPGVRERENADVRERYADEEVRSAHLSRQAQYRKRNPAVPWNSHLRRTYGISAADYDAMLKAQGGGCAICGKTHASKGVRNRFAVDHDHTTGRVRGILCHGCNRAIGILGDDTDGVRRALIYLERAQQPPSVAVAPAIRINLLQGAN